MQWPLVVIGGGHAGTEAAAAAARMGVRTLLVTHSLDTLGQMSCNPAIGGIGKGHLVREIDALGGLMGQAADACAIHARTLNESRGPAVRATRAQIDRALYRAEVRRRLGALANLAVFQATVEDLLVTDDRVVGVRLGHGVEVRAEAVVLTAGTFLAGRLHVGETSAAGGRAGCPAAERLAARLRELPLRIGRLKTGTPPRLDGRTIDYAGLACQPGDQPAPRFSALPRQGPALPQVVCHLTATNARTHDIIRAALHRSPMRTGAIEGVGPRYCPSVEDKVARFAERDAHPIFIEPEGLDTTEVYPNGISTSLPFEVQQDLVRSIRGFARAHLTRPGYAVEYDYLDPRDLLPTLASKCLRGLWLAGQVNGTTGYEEAAAQGLVAGVNAALALLEREPWVPRRDEAYLGVLVDDLVTRGTSEPYRMFTSRAEYRLQLREDNADRRLTPVGRALGLVDDERYRAFEEETAAAGALRDRLAAHRFVAGRDDDAYAALTGQPLGRDATALGALARPGVTLASLAALPGLGIDVHALPPARVAALESEVRYAGYLGRQQREIERQRRFEDLPLPSDLDYASVRGLSGEAVQRLTEYRPASMAHAARVPGVTPAALSLLLVHLRRRA